MTKLRRFWVVGPAVAVLALGLGWFLTRGAMEQMSFLKAKPEGEQGLVDQKPWRTASTLAPMAVSAEEQGFAREAERLADEEVNQAFLLAKRQAEMQHVPLKGEALALDERVNALKKQVADDTLTVSELTAASAKSGVSPMDGDSLDVAKAQLGLDTNELADAADDLARMSGDPRPRIQQELQQWQAALKKTGAITGDTAVAAAKRYATLWGRGNAWLEQRNRAALLADAERSASDDAKKLQAQHDQLESLSAADKAQHGGLTGTARVKMLQRLAGQRAMMSLLDQRAQDDSQLATVYAAWQAQVWAQHRMMGHLVLTSLLWIALIVLGAAVGAKVVKAALVRLPGDARKMQTLDTIVTLGMQVVSAVLILLVLFGPPEQTTTILGLATAGLTVVFQDYILSFFGWFALMGRNGVRVGDWVEINGIEGEVSTIGLFRTVLLETGNWTSQGHPTGRRITFSNSFAIRGQYFNFSTHGQWMWDEIQVHVPAGMDADGMIARLEEAIREEAAEDAARASREWQGVAGAKGLGQFNSAPTMNLRPAADGVDLIVRFMTRAHERFERRNRLYEAVRRILGERDGAALARG